MPSKLCTMHWIPSIVVLLPQMHKTAPSHYIDECRFITMTAQKYSSKFRYILNLTHYGQDKIATILLTTFSMAFFNKYAWISIKISLKLDPKISINDISALVQIMAWRRQGDKPLSELMMVSVLTHISFTRPQRVNIYSHTNIWNIVSSNHRNNF